MHKHALAAIAIMSFVAFASIQDAGAASRANVTVNKAESIKVSTTTKNIKNPAGKGKLKRVTSVHKQGSRVIKKVVQIFDAKGKMLSQVETEFEKDGSKRVTTLTVRYGSDGKIAGDERHVALHNAAGAVIAESWGVYNSNGKLIRNTVSVFTFDRNGYLVPLKKTYDSEGHVIEVHRFEYVWDKGVATVFLTERVHDGSGKLMQMTQPWRDKHGTIQTDFRGDALFDTRTFEYNAAGRLIGETVTHVSPAAAGAPSSGTLTTFEFKFDPARNYDPRDSNNQGGSNFDPDSAKTPLSYTQTVHRLLPNGAKSLIMSRSVTLQLAADGSVKSRTMVTEASTRRDVQTTVYDAAGIIRNETRHEYEGLSERFSSEQTYDEHGNKVLETNVFYIGGARVENRSTYANTYEEGRLAQTLVTVASNGAVSGAYRITYISNKTIQYDYFYKDSQDIRNSRTAVYLSGTRSILRSILDINYDMSGNELSKQYTEYGLYHEPYEDMIKVTLEEKHENGKIERRIIEREEISGRAVKLRVESIDTKNPSDSTYQESSSFTEDDWGNLGDIVFDAPPQPFDPALAPSPKAVQEAGAYQGDLQMMTDRMDLENQMEDPDQVQTYAQEMPNHQQALVK